MLHPKFSWRPALREGVDGTVDLYWNFRRSWTRNRGDDFGEQGDDASGDELKGWYSICPRDELGVEGASRMNGEESIVV